MTNCHAGPIIQMTKRFLSSMDIGHMIPILTWAYFFRNVWWKQHQLGLTHPLLQVPGHKIHFTATGSGANVSFEAVGGEKGTPTILRAGGWDWDHESKSREGYGFLGKRQLGKTWCVFSRSNLANDRLEAGVWYNKWQKTRARCLICSCPDWF